MLVRLVFIAVVAIGILGERVAVCQDPFGGKKPTPEQLEKLKEMRMKAAQQAGAKPGQSPMPGGEGDKKPDEKKEEGKEEKPATVKRSDTKPTERDPAELRKMKIGEDGKIQLSIEGQSWRHVIEWLGEVSGMPIDWTELPNDYLNLTTQTSYSPTECRNIINRSLLSRGYTLIEEDGFLSVHKTEGLNPTLVPRVSAEELGDHQQYEFVRVSFKLKWMLAEQAVAEFETLKSSNGKLTALATTNRLEAVDTVKALRLIHAVLQEEQSTESEEDLVEEFMLVNIRAIQARQKLEELLGIESKQPSRGPSSGSRDSQRMQQQMMQMMQQMQQQRGGEAGKGKKPTTEAKVRFIVNEQQNSVIAHAPPDKMAIIKRAVKLLDVPSGSWDSLEEYIDRTKTYRLVSLTPSEVIQILQETGGMDPSTVLRADDGSKSIIASAPPWDHLKITKLVEKLDGSARKLKVLPLRRLFADEVAGTLQALMVGPKKEENKRSRWGWYDDYSSRNNEKTETDSFRIDADVENNRLLLWCNENELTKVMEFLEELGEIRSTTANPSRYRVIDAFDPDEEAALLQRLKQAFEGLAPNKLQLPEPLPETTEPPAEEGAPILKKRQDAAVDRTEQEVRATPSDEEDRVVARSQLPPGYFKTAQLQKAEPPEDIAETPQSKQPNVPPTTTKDDVPPVKISRGRDGKLVITCQDPRALDLLEELLAEMAPAKKDYHVFELEVATPTWVVVNLEDYFEEDDKYNERFNAYWFDMPLDSDKNESRLSRRRPVRFIADDDTSTILVQDASREQLKTIKSLIELYDTLPKQTQAARISDVFPIKHHRASEIAEVIKDAYRDLLSDNDKALQGAGGKKEQKPETYIRTYNFGPSSDSGSDSERTRVTFKGKLSLGIDDTTNSLVVTTEGENLMALIRQMVEKLDKAATGSNTMAIMKVGRSVNAESLQKALSQLTGGQATKPKGPQPGTERPKKQGREEAEQQRQE